MMGTYQKDIGASPKETLITKPGKSKTIKKNNKNKNIIVVAPWILVKH